MAAAEPESEEARAVDLFSYRPTVPSRRWSALSAQWRFVPWLLNDGMPVDRFESWGTAGFIPDRFGLGSAVPGACRGGKPEGDVAILDPVQPARVGDRKPDAGRDERNGRVSSDWFNRPDDQRYLAIDDLWTNVKGRSEHVVDGW